MHPSPLTASRPASLPPGGLEATWEPRSSACRRVRIAIGLFASASVLLLASCSDAPPTVAVEGGYFAPRLSGSVGLAATATTDVSDLDLKSDLQLGQTDYVPIGRAEVGAYGWDLEASAFRTEQHGTGTLSVGFGSITAGSQITDDLTLSVLHGQLTLDLVNVDPLHLGIGVGADLVNVDLEVKDPVFTLSERVRVNEPVPLAVARVAIVPEDWPVSLVGSVGGMKATYAQISGTFLDAEALIETKVFGPFHAFAGYRYVKFGVSGTTSSQNFDGNVTLSGWIVGAALRF